MLANVIKAPAGLGKTRAFAERVAKFTTTTEVYVPTHKLAEECRDLILQVNPAKRVQIVRGRSFEVQPKVHLCARHLLADDLSKAGVPVYQNLCSKRQGPGLPPVQCLHYKSCGYIAQFGTADIHIYTHAHLALERGALEPPVPGIVIIDESFFQSLIEKITFPISLLTHPRIPPAAQQLCADVAAELTAGRRLRARFATAIGSKGEFNAAMKALKTSPALSPSLTDAALRANLANSVNFKPVCLLLAQLAEETKVRAIPQSVVLSPSGDITLHHKRNISRFDRDDGSQPKIFILDASASRAVIEPFFTIGKFTAIETPRNARVIQCHSTRCSTTSMVPSRNSDPQSRIDATRRLVEVQALIGKLAANGTKILVVGPVAVVGNPKTNALPLITVPPWCELAHFNALRGMDLWKDFDIVLVIGRNEPPVVEIENMARALFVMDPRPLNLTGQWEYQARGYRFADGQLGVDTAVHADRRVQALVEQLRESESLQAIDRLRLVHATTTKTVILLSNLPLDIDVHELRSWDELMNDTRLERAWDARGDVLPLNPDWLAANFSDLWRTAAAAKVDVSRACKKEHFPNISSIRKMFLFGYRYKLPQQRRWSRCVSSLAKPSLVAAALEKLLGKAVTVTREARRKAPAIARHKR